MKSNGKGKISYALQAINIIPLLFFGIIIMLLGTNWFTRCMYTEVQTELSDAVSYLTGQGWVADGEITDKKLLSNGVFSYYIDNGFAVIEKCIDESQFRYASGQI